MPKLFFIILVFILTACSVSATPATVVANVVPKPSATLTSLPATATPAPSPTFTLAPPPTLAPTATPLIMAPPFITRDPKAFERTALVPILMYHYIEPLAPNEKDNLRIELTVTPEKFEAQLKFFKERGYTSIDFYQWYAALARGEPLPAKPVIFSFDDGYGNLYEHAYPLMSKYGFVGTVFMITDFADANKKEYLTWANALKLARAGWRLESHTKDHPSLRGQSSEFQREQLRGSMASLQKQLGYAPRFLAYPYGHYDQTTIQVLQEVGYWGAVTTNIGRQHSFGGSFTAPRVRVNGSTTLPDLAVALGEKP